MDRLSSRARGLHCLIAYFGGRQVFVRQRSSESRTTQSSPSNKLGDTLANDPVAHLNVSTHTRADTL